MSKKKTTKKKKRNDNGDDDENESDEDAFIGLLTTSRIGAEGGNRSALLSRVTCTPGTLLGTDIADMYIMGRHLDKR